jgi:hypothetical protein
MGASQRLIRLDGLAQSVSCDRPVGVNAVRYRWGEATAGEVQARLTRETPDGAVMANNGSPFFQSWRVHESIRWRGSEAA